MLIRQHDTYFEVPCHHSQVGELPTLSSICDHIVQNKHSVGVNTLRIRPPLFHHFFLFLEDFADHAGVPAIKNFPLGEVLLPKPIKTCRAENFTTAKIPSQRVQKISRNPTFSFSPHSIQRDKIVRP